MTWAHHWSRMVLCFHLKHLFVDSMLEVDLCLVPPFNHSGCLKVISHPCLLIQWSYSFPMTACYWEAITVLLWCQAIQALRSRKKVGMPLASVLWRVSVACLCHKHMEKKMTTMVLGWMNWTGPLADSGFPEIQINSSHLPCCLCFIRLCVTTKRSLGIKGKMQRHKHTQQLPKPHPSTPTSMPSLMPRHHTFSTTPCFFQHCTS